MTLLNANVFDTIYRLMQARQARIIGINGVDTSGKTEFSLRFSRYLREQGMENQILHIDDFHNPRAIRKKWDYYDCAFDLQTVEREILQPLQSSGTLDASLLCLDLDSDEYKNVRQYRLRERDVLIVEGTLLFRPPLSPYFYLKIFLKIDFDEMLRRAELRDVPKYGREILQSYQSRYIPAQQRYFQECNPEAQSDILVDNSDWEKPILLRG